MTRDPHSPFRFLSRSSKRAKSPRRILFPGSSFATCGAVGLAACLLARPGHAEPETKPVDPLAPLIVTAKKDENYPVTDASTATRTDTPIKETPFSIQTIPRSVIEDQGVFRLKDVYRNVSGVAPLKTEGLGIQFENVYVRGFSQMLSVDGVNLYTMAPLNLAGLDRVEVLKGPASSLYGAIEPGGMVNAIPRTASFAAGSEVYGEIGSYDFYRAGFDSTVPIDKRVSVRLTGDVQNNESFRDFLDNRSIFLSPSVTWNISDQTRLTTWMWYQDIDRPHDNGVVFTPQGRPTGPISRNLAGPDHTTQAIEDFLYSLQVDHRINGDFSLRAKYLTHHFDGEYDAIRWSAAGPNRVSPYLDASSFENWEHNVLLEGLWKFEFGPTRHQLLFGVQGDFNDYNYNRLTATLPPINALNPVYPTGPYNLVPGFTAQKTLTKTLGAYLQEQMDAFDNRLHVLAGGRVDYVDQFQRAFANGNEFRQDDTGVTGRGGIVYDFTPSLSGFGNVSRSFNPNSAGTSLGNGGEPIDPTTGLSYEGGVKLSLLEQRLAITAAVYQVTKENVPVADQDHPGFVLNGGELRSKGVELDVLGQITSNLQIIGNYTYTDTEVLDSTTLPVGAQFLNIPEHSGSVWLKYNFTEGPLKNFGFGAGVFASGSKAADNNNTFELGGFARFDAGLWYRVELDQGRDLKLQINALNIFDTEYYESSNGTSSVQPGTPSAIFAKCSLTF